MIRKTLVAAAALTTLAAGIAEAKVDANGVRHNGVKFNGVRHNSLAPGGAEAVPGQLPPANAITLPNGLTLRAE